MLEPTHLQISGERFTATYRLAMKHESDARSLAKHICAEQTVEFPVELIPEDDISRHIVGRIESLQRESDAHIAVISYAVECVGGALPQLLNVLFGNCSLIPGVRLIDISLPTSMLDSWRGPRFGVTGIRRLTQVSERPLTMTALKPMGQSVERLAIMASDFAASGIDFIKDDHGLASQPFCNFKERVQECSKSVQRANQDHGTSARYCPSLNVPADEIGAAARFARDQGVGGLLVLPGLCGFDTMRSLADDNDLGLPIISHPSFLGSHSNAGDGGIDPGVLFGTFMRLAGADIVVFPNYGGRFSVLPNVCQSIIDCLRAPMGAIAEALPAPAGGMKVERLPEMIGFYGSDVSLLIGGELHRGDRREIAERMTAAANGVLKSG